MAVDTRKIDKAMIAAYKRGDSGASIAAVYGISEITVRKRLKDMGVKMRSRTSAWRGSK